MTMARRKSDAAKAAAAAEPAVSAGKPFKPQDYNAVARKARLATINLLDCRFRAKKEFFDNREDENARDKYYRDCDIEEPQYDREHGLAGGRFTWKLHVKAGRKTVLSLATTYFIVYENLEDMNTNAVKAFVVRVGQFATYPYFRALASQFSWESGAELPILPVISSTQ